MGYRKYRRSGARKTARRLEIPVSGIPAKSRPDADGITRIAFSSAGEVLDYIRDATPDCHSRQYADRSSFCPFTWEEAVTLLRSGWPEGVREIAFNTEKINSAIDEDAGYGIEYDTSGDYIDMGAYLDGTPECFGKVVSAEGPKETVRIVVSCSASFSVSEEVIRNRGAAICALIDQLRKTHFVSLDIVIDVENIMGCHRTETTFHVDMDNGYSRDLVSFCLACPAFLRRIFFSIVEQALGHKHCEGYGSPRGRECPPGVIHFPGIDWSSTSTYSTLESSIREVQRILDGIRR